MLDKRKAREGRTLPITSITTVTILTRRDESQTKQDDGAGQEEKSDGAFSAIALDDRDSEGVGWNLHQARQHDVNEGIVTEDRPAEGEAEVHHPSHEEVQ